MPKVQRRLVHFETKLGNWVEVYGGPAENGRCKAGKTVPGWRQRVWVTPTTPVGNLQENCEALSKQEQMMPDGPDPGDSDSHLDLDRLFGARNALSDTTGSTQGFSCD